MPCSNKMRQSQRKLKEYEDYYSIFHSVEHVYSAVAVLQNQIERHGLEYYYPVIVGSMDKWLPVQNSS